MRKILRTIIIFFLVLVVFTNLISGDAVIMNDKTSCVRATMSKYGDNFPLPNFKFYFWNTLPPSYSSFFRDGMNPVICKPPKLTINEPEQGATAKGNHIVLNWTITSQPGTDLMEAWIYGSNDTSNLRTSAIYNKKDLRDGTYVYHWQGMPIQPDDSTVLLLHFDNRSEFGENDSHIYDFSAQGNNGFCSQFRCPKWDEAGKFAGAFYFDGNDDYINLGQPDSLKLYNFTIMAWFKRTGPGEMCSTGYTGIADGIPIVTKGRGEDDGDTRDMNYWLGISDTTDVLAADFESIETENNNYPITGTTPIRDDIWYHAAVTYNGTSLVLYLNGGIEAISSPGKIPQGESIQYNAIGSAANSKGNLDGYFEGMIDEVAIYDRSLSAKEILFLARSQGMHYWQATLANSYGVDISDVWEFDLTLPVQTMGFFQYPSVSFHNETVEIIRFESNQAVNATVEYGTTPEYGTLLEEPSFLEFSTVHEFNISGLNPGTKYYYRINISSSSEMLEYFGSFNSSFSTADDSETSFVFAVLGDTRTQEASYKIGVNKDIFGRLISYIIDKKPAFVIIVGDVVESQAMADNDYGVARSAWKLYTDVVWNLSDHIPIYVAIGNHENPEESNALKRYREVVIHPHNGNGSKACDPNNCYDEVTYWFRYGNSLFVFLNTDELPQKNEANITGNQYLWFNKTLHKTNYSHKFVFSHRPLVGTNKSGTLLEEDPAWSVYLDNLMYERNVTAAFYGHEHIYCYNTTQQNGEMKHIITAGGGGELRDCSKCLGKVCVGDPEYHYIMVNITGNVMNVTVYNHTNAVKHRFGRVMGT